MPQEMTALIAAAASIGFLHTVGGPDHYLPFIMIAQARKWSRARTALITFLCGVGHVAGSVVLGVVGIAAGIASGAVVGAQSVRGEIAAWLLMAMGLVYMVWGIRRAWRKSPHTHGHFHLGGRAHQHEHSHDTDHAHPHESASGKKSVTPWVLFIIFVFGPCELLIPMLMYPAARLSAWGVAAVAGVFALTTIATMLAVVLASTFGLARLPTDRLQRYSHALAGAIILLCGASIQFLGL